MEVRSGQVGVIGVASYGTLGHVPPLDFQLVILGITRFTDSDESCTRFFCPVERFLAIGSADCHWIVALLCSRCRWERVYRI